jgi:hypothetical protein
VLGLACGERLCSQGCPPCPWMPVPKQPACGHSLLVLCWRLEAGGWQAQAWSWLQLPAGRFVGGSLHSTDPREGAEWVPPLYHKRFQWICARRHCWWHEGCAGCDGRPVYHMG